MKQADSVGSVGPFNKQLNCVAGKQAYVRHKALNAKRLSTLVSCVYIRPDCAPTQKVPDEQAPNPLAESAKQITCFEAQ